jgi:Protein of unknown function (DUF4241)
MNVNCIPKRRLMLAALGGSALAAAWPPALAQEAAAVNGGTPHRLPLAAASELEIVQPAEIDGEPIDLAVLALGVIDLPSGRLVGVDALLLEGAPYAPAVPPGRYPLQIVLARIPGGEERVAFIQLKLAARPATAWSNALVEGEDPAALEDDELSVFKVESGVAGVFDAAALAAWRTEIANSERLYRELEQVLRENRRPVWTWARVRAGGGSAFLMTAGIGEGEYAAYWGRDGDGAIVSFVLDFDLLEWGGLPAEPEVTT